MKPACITLLDMGREKYGDSALCQFGAKTILIDGGHLGDDSPSDGHASIPDQLKSITGRWPLQVDLLVVTHCHADHIGCLPKLVASGGLTAKWALVADPKLGWGKIGGLDGVDAPTAWDAVNPGDASHGVVTALMDDRPLDGLTHPELAAILADGVTLWDRYTQMLQKLEQGGTRVVRFGVDGTTQLTSAFADCGMRILGPTKAHLLLCARQLAKAGRDALDHFNSLSQQDAAADPPTLLRKLLANPQFAADMAGNGAALNSQSIVLRFEVNGHRLLLAGDMQFADPQVPGLEAPMKKLRSKVKSNGPYRFAKTCHHTSYNGLDETLLAEWGPATLLAHSGGLNDAGHPDAGALKDLRQLNRPKAFARTDRNGQIALDLGVARPDFKITRGRLDDFTVNPKPPPSYDTEAAESSASHEPVVVKTSGDFVEVVTRIPRQATKVTVTVEVEPKEQAPASNPETDPRTPLPAAPNLRLGGGRTLPRLLFVTSETALTRNLDANLVTAAKQAIRAAGSEIISDLPPAANVAQAAQQVRAALRGGTYQGVVILGGYDVVPAARLDALTPELRQAVEDVLPDPDDFIVWSDSVYADLDGDTFAELPISRIPDARSRDLFIAALQAGDSPAPDKLCVHNVKRPFAKAVFKNIKGRGRALSSEPAATGESRAEQPRMQGNLYLMLHGSDADGSAFWGEDNESGMMIEAFDVTCLPPRANGIIFTGACWGALVVTRKAGVQDPTRLPQSKPVEQSIALAGLRAGYRAFIGCTGSHYSPLGARPDSAGGPMHKFFWEEIAAGQAPAPALFAAKRAYAAAMPGHNDPVAQAIAQKIVRQFTCLGLGW